MVNPNPSFLSKRVQRRDQSGITSDRYQFLGLDQAEPDLGDPLVGVSSIGVNPFTVDLGDPFVLVSDGKKQGNRYWTQRSNIIAGGVVQPGAISIFTNGELASGTSELSVFKLNFTGAGVTAVGVGSDRADIDITVTDITLFTGQTGSIGYKDSSGLLQGADTLVFNPITGNVGVGSTQPTQRLDVIGSVKISDNLAVGGTITADQIIAGGFTVDRFNIKDNTIVFDIGGAGVGIGTTQPIAILDVRGDVNISGFVTVGNLRSNGVILGQTLGITSSASVGSLSIGNTQVISSTRQLQNIISLDSITTATIETAIANAPNTFTDLNIVGFATIANLGVLGLTTTRDFITSGIATIPRLNVTQALNSTGISTITNLRSTNVNVAGITTLNSLGVSGLTTSRSLVVYETLDANLITAQNIGVASSVGIGTTVAKYELDVNGDINISKKISLANGGFGVENQVLLSGGVGQPARWGQPEGITVGSAASVGTFDVNEDSIYYITFVPKTEGVQSVYLDSNGITYNPFTNRLGIGTTTPSANLNVSGSTLLTGTNTLSGITTVQNTLDINTTNLRYNPTNNRLGIGTTNPGSTLAVGGTITEEFAGQYWNVVTQADVGYGASQVPLNQFLGQLAFLDEYLPPQFRNTEVVTTSTSNVTVDSLDGNFERSARYNIQVTCNGQLIGSGTSASSRSVTNLQQGQDYVSGNYTNIALSLAKGTGNDARSNLTVTPEATLTLTAIQNGEFAFQQDVSSLNINKPILFNQSIPSTASENSRVTSIRPVNVGSGYTSFPSVTIASPTNNPPIPGVSGIGSTATAVVSTMAVANYVLTKSGIHTTIPTVTFNSPVGVGTTAEGIVGFGISTIVVTNSGSNYSYIPSVSVSLGNTTGIAATARVNNTFLTNIRIRESGFGYSGTGGSNYPTITVQSPTSGTTAIATVTTLGLSTYFSIPSTGIGYTRPPLLTVSAPGIGTTAIIGNTLGVVTFTNITPGFGYTIAPSLSLSPTVIGLSANVGMGVSSENILIFGGGGYESNPSITFDPVGGIGTGAQGLAQINISGQLESIIITNTGFGYTVPPTIVFSGGNPSVSAAATITTLIFTNIEVIRTGFGVTVVPTTFLVPSGGLGEGASASALMGIGTVFILESGSGYTSTPAIAVTAVDGITGNGATVTSLGLGVYASNISVINPGIGYTFVPTVTISSPTGIGTSATALAGMGISSIIVTSPGIGYLNTIPSVSFSGGGEDETTGSGVGAAVSTIITTNVVITNAGAGYTQFDLTQSGIATFNPEGTEGIVGFGVSTFELTSLGIGYTNTQSAAITISNPNLGSGVTATAIAGLGFPGVLPGPGYGVTTQIYYIAEIPSSTTLKLSTRPGIGTLSQTDVANVGFAVNNPIVFAGGRISNVSVVSPGSGYTSGSILSVINTFDGGNVGSGFSFVASPVDNFQVSDVMLLQSNGSANPRADFIEYSTIANEEILGSFSATMIAGASPTYTANLIFTPTYRNNTIKISRNKFGV
jgi:hypothetical protein